MLDLTISFESPASPPEAFDYVVNGFFDNHPQWDPAIVELTQTTPGPVGVGTTGVEVRRFLTRQAAEFVVTEVQPPERFAFRNTTGPFTLERAYSFSPKAGGALVAFTFRMAPRSRAVAVPWPLLRKVIAGQVRANIERLESLLRARAGATVA